MTNNLILKFKNNTRQAVSEQFVFRVLSVCLKKYKLNQATEISVLIVGNNTIRNLNKQYRKKDYVTDVLSFPQVSNNNLLEELNGYNLLGDIVICWPKLVLQAQSARHNVKKELQLLLEHSFKHLIGIHHKGD